METFWGHCHAMVFLKKKLHSMSSFSLEWYQQQPCSALATCLEGIGGAEILPVASCYGNHTWLCGACWLLAIKLNLKFLTCKMCCRSIFIHIFIKQYCGWSANTGRVGRKIWAWHWAWRGNGRGRSSCVPSLQEWVQHSVEENVTMMAKDHSNLYSDKNIVFVNCLLGLFPTRSPWRGASV